MNIFSDTGSLWLLALMFWVLPWKGVALWHASQRKEKVWFVLLLVLNTFAILDIFYIVYIAKKGSDIRSFFRNLGGTSKKQ